MGKGDCCSFSHMDVGTYVFCGGQKTENRHSLGVAAESRKSQNNMD